jgi:hypothetical protein
LLGKTLKSGRIRTISRFQYPEQPILWMLVLDTQFLRRGILDLRGIADYHLRWRAELVAGSDDLEAYLSCCRRHTRLLDRRLDDVTPINEGRSAGTFLADGRQTGSAANCTAVSSRPGGAAMVGGACAKHNG